MQTAGSARRGPRGVAAASVARRLLRSTFAIAVLVAAAGAPTALAAAPTAVTGPVTAVSSSSATVTGTVDPGGASTTWYVEYGTGTDYGSKTSAKSAGSGSSAVAVSATLDGLAQGTTYHYRVVAKNGGGTGSGSDAVFTTWTAPAATTEPATGVSTTAAELQGTVDPNGRATTWHFDYGTSSSYGSSTPDVSAGSGTSARSASARITGLEPGRTFHFRLVAASDAGTATGGDRTFTTSAAPSATTAGASSVTPTSATVHGSVTPNGLATTWWFEYGTTASYGSRSAKHSAGSGTSAHAESATLRGLRRTTFYHYRLVAENSAGRSYGADQTFATSFPPAVQTGAATGTTATSTTLGGTVDPNGRRTSWYFQYGTTTGYGSRTATQSAGSGSTGRTVGATLTGLAPGTTYHFRLVASNDAGTTKGSDAAVTTLGVTLVVRARTVVYGRGILLSGVVPSGQQGQQVIVYARPYGSQTYASVATLLSGPGGTWRYVARPARNTAYEAGWQGSVSRAVGIGVRPAISFAATRSGRLLVRVRPAGSFAHRVVRVQRRSGGRWATLRTVRLGRRSAAAFKVALARGTSTLRITFSVNQAGVGYLGAIGRTLSVHRA